MKDTKSLRSALLGPKDAAATILLEEKHRITVERCFDDLTKVATGFLAAIARKEPQPDVTYAGVEHHFKLMADRARELRSMIDALIHPMKKKKREADLDQGCVALLECCLDEWKAAGGDAWIQVDLQTDQVSQGPRVTDLATLASALDHISRRIAAGKEAHAAIGRGAVFGGYDPFESVVRGVYDSIRRNKRPVAHCVPIAQAIYQWATDKTTNSGKAYLERWERKRKTDKKRKGADTKPS